MSQGHFREVFEAAQGTTFLPELSLVGWARLARARVPGLRTHAHEDALEIFFLERGRVEWWVENEVHRLEAGDVFLNRPGEVHGSVGGVLRPCGYYWINLRLPTRGLPGMTSAVGRALGERLRGLARRRFPGSPELKAAFASLWRLHREPPKEAVTLALRGQLHLLLAWLLRDHSAAERGRHIRGFSTAVRRALKDINARPTEPHSVEELAHKAGLGVTQFAERFAAETGFTAAAYVRRQRIELAKERMLSGEVSMAALAAELGFSSSQHFATVFKKLEGVKPSEFRRDALAKRD